LNYLGEANDRVGGNDPEFLDYLRRYGLILEKLQAVLHKSGV